MYSNWDFWFENIPSGNPAWKQSFDRNNYNTGVVVAVGYVECFKAVNIFFSFYGVQ
jgi:hypothetical protein